MKEQTYFLIVMGDINNYVGTKYVGETTIGNFGIGKREGRVQLVQFSKRNRLRIMNKLFKKSEEGMDLEDLKRDDD